MSEIVFEVSQEPDGGYIADCLTVGIFTQADNWGELRRNVKETVAAAFRKLRAAGQAFSVGRVGLIVRSALQKTFQVFEGYVQ